MSVFQNKKLETGFVELVSFPYAFSIFQPLQPQHSQNRPGKQRCTSLLGTGALAKSEGDQLPTLLRQGCWPCGCLPSCMDAASGATCAEDAAGNEGCLGPLTKRCRSWSGRFVLCGIVVVYRVYLS